MLVGSSAERAGLLLLVTYAVMLMAPSRAFICADLRALCVVHAVGREDGVRAGKGCVRGSSVGGHRLSSGIQLPVRLRKTGSLVGFGVVSVL